MKFRITFFTYFVIILMVFSIAGYFVFFYPYSKRLPNSTNTKNSQLKKSGSHISFFMMSFCPYSGNGLKILEKLKKELRQNLTHEFHYLVTEDSETGEIQSLHGQEELQEDLRQIAIREIAPDLLLPYLLCADSLAGDSQRDKCLKKLGLKKAEIDSFVSSGLAMEFLESDMKLSDSLEINSSPTILVNGSEYYGALKFEDFLKFFCLDSPGFDICSNVEKPLPIKAVIIYSTKAVGMDTNGITRALKSMFPGVNLKMVPVEAEDGRNLAATCKLLHVPAIVFEPLIEKTENYKEISGRLEKVQDYYLDRIQESASRFLLYMPFKQGKLQVFFSGLSPQAYKMIAELGARFPKILDIIEFHYMVRSTEKRGFYSIGGGPELDEVRRQLVIKNKYPQEYRNYINARGRMLETSYWDDVLKEVRLPAQDIKTLATSDYGKNLLIKEAALCDSLNIQGEILFVINNSEVIYVREVSQLEEYFKTLKNSR